MYLFVREIHLVLSAFESSKIVLRVGVLNSRL